MEWTFSFQKEKQNAFFYVNIIFYSSKGFISVSFIRPLQLNRLQLEAVWNLQGSSKWPVYGCRICDEWLVRTAHKLWAARTIHRPHPFREWPWRRISHNKILLKNLPRKNTISWRILLLSNRMLLLIVALFSRYCIHMLQSKDSTKRKRNLFHRFSVGVLKHELSKIEYFSRGLRFAKRKRFCLWVKHRCITTTTKISFIVLSKKVSKSRCNQLLFIHYWGVVSCILSTPLKHWLLDTICRIRI